MKKTMSTLIAVLLSLAVMVTFIPLTASPVMAKATKSGEPYNIKCIGGSKTSVTLSWNTDKKVKGYKIYQKKGDKFEAVKKVKKSEATIEGLEKNTKYSFKIRSYNGIIFKKYSGYSKTVTVQTASAKTKVKAKNGNMIGLIKSGVHEFKGIPFAKPPVGKLRFKKPVAPEPSTENIDCSNYGYSALQIPWHSEDASTHKQSEDCLTLNVWTKNPTAKVKKPVFFFIHGGAHIMGGTSDELYDGHNIIKEYGDDIIMVSANYRLNMMGLVDLSSIEGGEDYPDAPWLCLYDNIAALQWVQENIAQFGGDPNNVTIMGESAGAAEVSLLPIMDECSKGQLFNKVIIESGGVDLTNTKDHYQALTKNIKLGYMLEKSEKGEDGKYQEGLGKGSVPTMDDLIALSPSEMKKLMRFTQCCNNDGKKSNDGLGNAISCGESEGDYNYPMRGGGGPFPETVAEIAEKYQNIENITFLSGTNENEFNYWVGEMTNKKDKYGKIISGSMPTDEDYDIFDEYYGPALLDLVKEPLKKCGKLDDFNKVMKNNGYTEPWQKGSQSFSELFFRMPQILQAENSDNTYMYYWKHPSTIKDYGACHAVELAYVFGNLEDSAFSGKCDPELAKKVMGTWVNFIKDGKPKVEGQNIEWPKYDKENRATMVIPDSAKARKWTVKNDPEREIREIFMEKSQKTGKSVLDYMEDSLFY